MIYRVTWGDGEQLQGVHRFSTRYEMHRQLHKDGWSLSAVNVLEKHVSEPVPNGGRGWIQLDIMEATPCENQ